jgi:hypothetical protein
MSTREDARIAPFTLLHSAIFKLTRYLQKNYNPPLLLSIIICSHTYFYPFSSTKCI